MLKKVLDPYNLNALTQKIATSVFENDRYYKKNVVKIKTTRESFKQKLQTLGFNILPSKTNFLMAKPKTKKATILFEYLKKKDIYLIHFNSALLKNYLRITIGTPEEMETLYESIVVFSKKNN